MELQELADELGCASRRAIPRLWNEIEHRMFSHVTRNWRGWPLTGREENSIGAVTTNDGYATGRKVRAEQLAKLDIE